MPWQETSKIRVRAQLCTGDFPATRSRVPSFLTQASSSNQRALREVKTLDWDLRCTSVSVEQRDCVRLGSPSSCFLTTLPRGPEWSPAEGKFWLLAGQGSPRRHGGRECWSAHLNWLTGFSKEVKTWVDYLKKEFPQILEVCSWNLVARRQDEGPCNLGNPWGPHWYSLAEKAWDIWSLMEGINIMTKLDLGISCLHCPFEFRGPEPPSGSTSPTLILSSTPR